MKNEAIFCFMRFTEINVVKHAVKYSNYKNENEGISETDFESKFPFLWRKTSEYQYYLNLMEREHLQIFQVSPRSIIDEIKLELDGDWNSLSQMVKPESLKNLLSQNNPFKISWVLEPHGGRKEIRQDQLPAKRLKEDFFNGPQFGDFSDFMSTQLISFGKVAGYILGASNQTLYGRSHLELPMFVNSFILDKQSFDKVCQYYTEPRVLDNGKKEIIISFNSTTYKYRWHGIGKAVIPTLTQFLSLLLELKIIGFNGHDKNDFAKSFLDYFQLKPKDISFLTDEIFQMNSHFKNFRDGFLEVFPDKKKTLLKYASG